MVCWTWVGQIFEPERFQAALLYSEDIWGKVIRDLPLRPRHPLDVNKGIWHRRSVIGMHLGHCVLFSRFGPIGDVEGDDQVALTICLSAWRN